MRWCSLLALSGCSGSGLSPNLVASEADRGRECSTLTEGPEGAFALTRASGVRTACVDSSHAIGGAAGQRIRIDLARWMGTETATLRVRDWNGEDLEVWTGLREGDAVELIVPWTGEQRLTLAPEGPTDGGGDYRLDVTCLSDCSARWSRFPFLVMHGFGSSGGSFEDLVAVVEEAGYVAWAPSVSKFEPSPVRAAQWREHLDGWRSDGTWRGVHLIGHSMGGLDARYLAAHLDRDGWIRTVTTLSTPHHGTPVADIALGLVDHDYTPAEVGELVASLAPEGGVTTPSGEVSAALPGLTAQLYQLSRPGALAFNQTVPDRPDVRYRSWTGMTCGTFDLFCQWDWDFEIVALALKPTHAVMKAHGLPSDGAVDVWSGVWGEFGGVLAADHFEMGGGRLFAWPSFDDEGFFMREADRLAMLEFDVDLPGEEQARTLEELDDLDW